MGKKRKNVPSLDEILERPFCYYCERDFDDNRILIAHQKAKHYKCDKCNRRLNTAGGLQVHMQQVHKEQLTKIENAIEGREDVSIEIFGMVGIPEDLMNSHKQKVTEIFYKEEAEHRAATGNPAPGSKGFDGDSGTKKAKMETPEEIQARVAETRRKNQEKKRLQAEMMGQPQGTTPATTSASAFPPVTQPGFPPTTQPGFPPTTQPGFPPTTQQAFPTVTHPGMPPSPASSQAFLPQQPMYQPPQQLSSGAAGPLPRPFPGARPPQPARSPLAGTPSFAFPKPPEDQGFQQYRRNTDLPNFTTRNDSQIFYPPGMAPPGTPAGLPPALLPSGLPTRPSFDSPNMSREDMQRLHVGHPPPLQSAAQIYPRRPTHPRLPNMDGANDDDGSVQELIKTVKHELSEKDRAAQQQAKEATTTDSVNPVDTGRPAPVAEAQQADTATSATATPAPVAPATPATKKEKKSKKNVVQRQVYTDNATSPEEKKARSRKYLFNRGDQTQFTMGPPDGAVSGVAMDQDTVLDPMADH